VSMKAGIVKLKSIKFFNLIKESTIEQCEIVLETFVECDYSNECNGVELAEDIIEAGETGVSTVRMNSESESQEFLTPTSQEWEGDSKNIKFVFYFIGLF